MAVHVSPPKLKQASTQFLDRPRRREAACRWHFGVGFNRSMTDLLLEIWKAGLFRTVPAPDLTFGPDPIVGAFFLSRRSLRAIPPSLQRRTTPRKKLMLFRAQERLREENRLTRA